MQMPAFASFSPVAPAGPLLRRHAHSRPGPTPYRRSPRCAAASPPGPAQTPAQQPKRDADESAPQLSGWRAARARLVAAERAASHLASCWGHELSVPEVGCVLVAAANHTWPRAVDYLDNAVVLVTKIGDDGVSGLILNRPTGARVDESRSVLCRVGKEFAANEVRLAGDACMGHVDILHGHPEVQGAEEIVPGVWHGGLNSCRELVASGQARAEEFCVMISYARWSTEQFREEMALGAWSVASVAPEVLLEAGCGARQWKEDPRRLWKKVNALTN